MKRTFKKEPVTAAKIDAFGTVFDKVAEWVEHELEEKFEDNLAIIVASDIHEYDSAWCIEDTYGKEIDACTKARKEYARALAACLMAQYREDHE